MTDTPGWVSPSSPGPDPEDTRPAAAAPPGVDGPPGVGQEPAPGTAQPVGSVPPPYTGAPYGQPQTPPPAAQQAWGPMPGWGQPGPGAQPGSPFTGWGAPQSPKPGVIPLRPLGAGEILDGAISTTRRYWRVVLGLSLVVSILVNTTLAAVSWWSRQDGVGVASVVLLVATGVLDVLAGLLLTALLTMVVSKAILGDQVSLGSAWQAARPQIWRLLGLTLLVGLIVGGIMAVCLVPVIVLTATTDANPGAVLLGAVLALAGGLVSVWLGIRLSLAAPALMLEKQGVKAAMSRSRRLVRGSWWRIFGITLLGYVLTVILSGMVNLPCRFLANAVNGAGDIFGTTQGTSDSLAAVVVVTIGTIIGSVLGYPIQAGINVLLYVDQRIRREALDLELARAAGLPEYGGTGWAGQPTPPAGV